MMASETDDVSSRRHDVVSIYPPDSVGSGSSYSNYHPMSSRTLPTPPTGDRPRTLSTGSDTIDERVLLKYSNSCLPLATKEITIADFESGETIEQLLVSLSGDKYKCRNVFGQPYKTKERIQRIFKYLKTKEIWTKTPKNLPTELSEQIILEILKHIIFHYKIVKPLKKTHKATDPDHLLLHFVNSNLPSGTVENLLSDWTDGQPIAAMLCSMSSGKLCPDWTDMNMDVLQETIPGILTSATRHFPGVISLLEPDDFYQNRLTKTCVMVYVAQFISAHYVDDPRSSSQPSHFDPAKEMLDTPVRSEGPYADHFATLSPADKVSGWMEKQNTYSSESGAMITRNPPELSKKLDDEDFFTGTKGNVYMLGHAKHQEPTDIYVQPSTHMHGEAYLVQPSDSMKEAMSILNEQERLALQPYIRNPDSLIVHKDHILGEGEYGMVYRGRFLSDAEHGLMSVAAKTVKSSGDREFLKSGKRNLVRESAIMASLNHENITKLIALVDKDDLYVLLHSYKHNLLEYVKDDSMDRSKTCLNGMVMEVAEGMRYLSQLDFIHRDLAARNCMVTRDQHVKIGDFGSARDVFRSEYVSSSGGLIPFRWSAPEILEDNRYSKASDVWAFGVLYWEVLSHGQQPYSDIPNDRKLTLALNRGVRLQRPQYASEAEYKLMLQCWSFEPNHRPTFDHILPPMKADLFRSSSSTGSCASGFAGLSFRSRSELSSQRSTLLSSSSDQSDIFPFGHTSRTARGHELASCSESDYTESTLMDPKEPGYFEKASDADEDPDSGYLTHISVRNQVQGQRSDHISEQHLKAAESTQSIDAFPAELPRFDKTSQPQRQRKMSVPGFHYNREENDDMQRVRCRKLSLPSLMPQPGFQQSPHATESSHAAVLGELQRNLKPSRYDEPHGRYDPGSRKGSTDDSGHVYWEIKDLLLEPGQSFDLNNKNNNAKIDEAVVEDYAVESGFDPKPAKPKYARKFQNFFKRSKKGDEKTDIHSFDTSAESSRKDTASPLPVSPLPTSPLPASPLPALPSKVTDSIISSESTNKGSINRAKSLSNLSTRSRNSDLTESSISNMHMTLEKQDDNVQYHNSKTLRRSGGSVNEFNSLTNRRSNLAESTISLEDGSHTYVNIFDVKSETCSSNERSTGRDKVDRAQPELEMQNSPGEPSRMIGSDTDGSLSTLRRYNKAVRESGDDCSVYMAMDNVVSSKQSSDIDKHKRLREELQKKMVGVQSQLQQQTRALESHGSTASNTGHGNNRDVPSAASIGTTNERTGDLTEETQRAPSDRTNESVPNPGHFREFDSKQKLSKSDFKSHQDFPRVSTEMESPSTKKDKDEGVTTNFSRVKDSVKTFEKGGTFSAQHQLLKAERPSLLMIGKLPIATKFPAQKSENKLKPDEEDIDKKQNRNSWV